MASEEDVSSCTVCQEIYNDPRFLLCGHSFCLQCIQMLAGNRQKFTCPICRFIVDLRDGKVDQLPKNFVLSNVIEAKGMSLPSMCLEHKKLLDMFCEGCDVVICSKCLLAQHKSHAIEDIDKIFAERNLRTQDILSAFLVTTKMLTSMLQERRNVVQQSRNSMEKNADSIQKTVVIMFKKWKDDLQTQENKALSYLKQERDKQIKPYQEAESFLKSSMTDVTKLESEIIQLRTKDTTFVVQQYGSVKARKEDTESRVHVMLKQCLTSTDYLKMELIAPWMEEAIDNIKLTDMEARQETQKIAEIQRENTILKRKILACDTKKISLENENAEWEKETIDLQRRLEEEKQKVMGIETKMKAIKEKNETELESLRKILKEREDSLSKLEGCKKTLQKHFNQLEQDMERKLNQRKTESDKYCTKLTQKHTKEREFLHNAIESLTVEKEQLLTRLSMIARERLTHGNVNIADLSDADLPTKLQEVYSELFDNEWTDAFEELTKHQNISENDAIMLLLKILMSSFQNCREITWGRYERLIHVSSSIYTEQRNFLSSAQKVRNNVSEPCLTIQEAESSRAQQDKNDKREDHNAAKENIEMGNSSRNVASNEKFANENGKMLRSTTDKRLDNLQEETSSSESAEEKGMQVVIEKVSISNAAKYNSLDKVDEAGKSSEGAGNEDIQQIYSVIETCLDMPFRALPMTSKYLTRCIDLCWKMGVQEKPLHLDSLSELEACVGKRFDKDKFRAYTKSGKIVAFVVWPSLYLYEGGPVLVKGIAQGCASDEKRKSEIHS